MAHLRTAGVTWALLNKYLFLQLVFQVRAYTHLFCARSCYLGGWVIRAQACRAIVYFLPRRLCKNPALTRVRQRRPHELTWSKSTANASGGSQDSEILDGTSRLISLTKYESDDADPDDCTLSRYKEFHQAIESIRLSFFSHGSGTVGDKGAISLLAAASIIMH